MTETVLEVNDLHVSFDIAAGEVQAVRGVDFHLNKVISRSRCSFNKRLTT